MKNKILGSLATVGLIGGIVAVTSLQPGDAPPKMAYRTVRIEVKQIIFATPVLDLKPGDVVEVNYVSAQSADVPLPAEKATGPRAQSVDEVLDTSMNPLGGSVVNPELRRKEAPSTEAPKVPFVSTPPTSSPYQSTTTPMSY